jgi:glycerate dehydrogenase
VTLEELLKQSDFISLHCPLFPETAQMVNEAFLNAMKDGV